MAIKGFSEGVASANQTSSMRGGGWTQPEGFEYAIVVECIVEDVNLVNWTVDVRTVFDQKSYKDVSIATPYIHHNRGEGVYAMPEINSKCLVLLPSDGGGITVIGFITSMESKEPNPEEGDDTRISFAGGRARAKPGDIILKGRDDNFVMLHRGGVVQIGASALAQRFYIPILGMINDVSLKYQHQNIGGDIRWEAVSAIDDNPDVAFTQTFRLKANDESASIKLQVGKVKDTPTSSAELEAYGLAGIDQNAAVIELSVSPENFKNTGQFLGVRNELNFKFLVTSDGSLYTFTKKVYLIRTDDAYIIQAKKKVSISSEDSISISAKKSLNLQGDQGIRITAKDGVVSLQGGSDHVARVGSTVRAALPAPLVAPFVGVSLAGPISGTVTIPMGVPITGTVTTGNPRVLV